MRFLIAPQEFKGSLTAVEAASAIAAGASTGVPGATTDELPLSDGGPGLVDVMLAALGGRREHTRCSDPLMRPITATFGLLPDRTAVIEMAAASGLVLLAPTERNPLLATTYGTGELIRAALDRGCREIIVGVGGSATVEAGAGAMQALGARLLDASGRDLSRGGGALGRLARIDLRGVDPRLREARVRIASDVRNPLFGPEGAAAVFGPQKGASSDEVRVLDAGLRRFAEIVARDCGIEVTDVPGSGAAGGLGAGLMAVAGSTIEPGFDLVAETVGLRDCIAAADAVITGEGRLDAQTLYGKTASGVVARAHHAGKPVGVVAGIVDPSYVDDGAFDAIEASKPADLTVEQAMRLGRPLVEAAARRLAVRLSRLVR
jgi:glycerate kinase